MNILETITEAFVKESREILGDNLVGVYLHGSAVMECFNEKKSDIDLLVVINKEISDEIKMRYMDMVVRLKADAPEKGIEMSIVRKEVCKPFVYPTPFELHFSITHLGWYTADSADYVAKMKGTDRDLAAHFTIIYHRGKCLYGEEIENVFEKVSRKKYFDSILSDIEDAKEDIITNPAYIVLNLCRVLAYKREGLILSKKEGGDMGGGLRIGSKEGNSLQKIAPYWPKEQIIFCPNYQSLYSTPDKCWNVFEDYGIKAYGFSKCGKYFVVATSSDLIVYKRIEE